jgi:plasmid replication initiation protein
MVGNNTKNRTSLLPDRHPIQDFFICDVTDAIPKDDMGSMEHPIFSLATKPDLAIREYEHNGIRVSIVPSALGLATIHDKDVLIYCISQLMAKMKAGAAPNRTLHIKAHDLLVATNRNIDGRGYEQLVSALERLRGTSIKTNIKTGGEEITSGFGLIDSWNIIRHTSSGRMSEMRLNLSEWIYNAVTKHEVLTMHRDYFRLRKPLERRMYELARKHCGQQDEWSISLDLLKKKCGAASSDKEFRRLVGIICEEDAQQHHMPDYAVRLEDDKVRFTNRNTMKALPPKEKTLFPLLEPETYNEARIVAPGSDVYALEEQWQEFWVASGKPELKDADAAFIGFCKYRHSQKPRP